MFVISKGLKALFVMLLIVILVLVVLILGLQLLIVLLPLIILVFLLSYLFKILRKLKGKNKKDYIDIKAWVKKDSDKDKAHK